MSRLTGFGYAQARLQARHGAQPDGLVWRRLNASISLAHFLQSARHSPLRPWVVHMGPHNPVHEIELSLRKQFRQYVHEVAAWQPGRWPEAARWVSRLPDLPVLQHLLEGRAAPAWVVSDPWLGGLAAGVQELRTRAIAESEYGPLLRHREAGIGLALAWRIHWRSLWPETPPRHARALDGVADLVADHFAAMEAGGVSDSRFLFEHLETALRKAFRRHPQQPATAFIHLALVALNVSRLRGALVRRALFATAGDIQ